MGNVDLRRKTIVRGCNTTSWKTVLYHSYHTLESRIGTRLIAYFIFFLTPSFYPTYA